MTRLYELWHSPTTSAYSFFERGHHSQGVVLEPDAVLLWTVEASSPEEATAKRNKHLGWEPYTSMQSRAP
jgi:hypothetical protein